MGHSAKLLSAIRLAACLVLVLSTVNRAAAQQRTEAAPDAVAGVGVDEHLDERIPLQLTFQDEFGKTVRLERYFTGDKPVVLTLNYYTCPMLCTLQLNGMVDALKLTDLQPGKDFELVTVSFDPTETPNLAKLKKQSYVSYYGVPGAGEAWHFLTGEPDNIRKLTEAIGFNYTYDEQQQQYVHAAVTMVVTPGGELSRYLYGVQLDPQTLRLSLVEAGQGRIGSPMDQVILYCYLYNADEGRYAIAAMNVMRAGALLTVLVLGVAALVFRQWEKRRQGQGAEA